MAFTKKSRPGYNKANILVENREAISDFFPVCIYGYYTYSKSMDQPGKVANIYIYVCLILRALS